ncbi:MAG: hypothetical protein AB7T49_19210 [Oligoflexales bacterium]
MKLKRILLIVAFTALTIPFACKSRRSNLANAQSSGDDLKRKITDCGNSAQCVGFVLADAIIALGGGGGGDTLEKVSIEYFETSSCQEGVLRTQGHDGKNLETYCTAKGNPTTRSIKLGGKCIKASSSSGCTSYAAEKDFGQDLIEAYQESDCTDIVMILGDRRDLPLSEYCALKAGDGGNIHSYKVGAGECQHVAGPSKKSFCEQYSY